MFLSSLPQVHSLTTVFMTLASSISPYAPNLPMQPAAEFGSPSNNMQQSIQPLVQQSIQPSVQQSIQLSIEPSIQTSIVIPIPVPPAMRRSTQQNSLQQSPIQQSPPQSFRPSFSHPSRLNSPIQATPPQPDASAIAPQVLFLRQAIIGQESGANFRAINRHSGALGYGQIMPFNLPSWSQEALGYEVDREDFLNSPEIQLAIIDYKLNQYWQRSIAASQGDEEIAVMRVAAWWYCGKPDRYASTTTEYYGGYPYPSIADYSRSVWQRYQRVLSQAAEPARLTQYGQRTGEY